MKNMKRHGELHGIHFRSNRFFTVANKWYFSTREGFDSGPYANRTRAQDGLRRFLKVAKLLPKASKAKSNVYRIY